MDLLAPNVTIPKTTFTTAQVDWTGIGADADRFEVHLSRVDADDTDEEKVTTIICISCGADFCRFLTLLQGDKPLIMSSKRN